MKRIKHILIAAMVLIMVVMFANANIPPAPAGLDNDTGDYWVNYTWSKELDDPVNNNVTDSFNVSMNGTWYNGTATFLNEGVGPGGWANITAWAYNATGNGNRSVDDVSDSVQAPSAATELPRICGYIPPPMDLSHLGGIPVKGIQAPGELPSSFDWRDSGNVTPVKDQSTCGTCWTFGTTSVLESAVLINEGAEYNFSEQSIALCVDHSWTRMYNDTDDPCNAGGNSFIASEVFIKKGSVLESCNPYNTTALKCDGSCVCDDCAPVKRVDGYRLVTNDGSEIDVIKNAVYDHGPVTMAFYYDPSGNYSVAPWGTIYDYYPNPGYANHLVSIIGWNDSVPHPDTDHNGTGAWIVKNSWGTGWGNDGYFYLAYNSSCVEEIAYLECKDPVPDEELLYWDEAGFVGSVGYSDSGAWMASNFTADQSGNLTHVDFWTTSNNAEYEIYVWDSYFGSELANQTGTCQELGYYSIPLNTPIPMDAGQQFTVGVNITTPDYGHPIPVEFAYPDMVDPTIQTDVSFIRHNSSSEWTDLATYGGNACLRARMVATFSCTCGDICANTSGWWRDGGVFNANATMPIQAAVDNATAGETICVAAGSYTENVNIGTPHLTLVGEGADVVNVRADSISDHVFEVTADYVNISGFNVTGATSGGKAGIYLSGRQHCNISDNRASNSYYGIRLNSSSNNTVTKNNASNGDHGICMGYSSNYNTVTNNIADSNTYEGIRMWDSCNNNTVTNNTANSNKRHGIYLDSSSENTLTGNTASNNEECGIMLEYSSNDNTLTGNTANSNNWYGIWLYDSSNNTLTGNTASGNYYGIWLSSSSNNTLSNNMMSGNDYNFGVYADSLSDYTQNIDMSNTVDGKPIYYWVDQQGGQIPTDAGYVGVVNCTNTIVQDLNLTKNLQGILFVNTSNSIIENVTASDNWVGTYLEYSSNNTLMSNTASDNGYGILLEYSSNNTLSSNTASNNGCGIMLGAGVGMAEGVGNKTASNNFGRRSPVPSNDILADNDASDKGYGIVLDAGVEMVEGASNNTLTGNIASNNWYGIWLYDSSNNTLTGNTASNNGCGIVLGAGMIAPDSASNTTTSNNFGRMSPVSSNDTLADNDASDKGYGIVPGAVMEMVESTSNNTLTGNTASDNEIGIVLEYSSNNTLTGNTASGNGEVGIVLVYSSNDNTLTSNTASNNWVGIYIIDESNNNTLTGNTANSNIVAHVLPANGGPPGSGIWLEYSSNNTLTSNTALDNSDWDIYIDNSPSNTFADNTLNGTTVSFTYSGDVSLRGTGLPAAGAPWYSIGKFIDVTNQSVGAWMILNFSYSDSDFTGAMDESNLMVWKYNGTWYEDGWNGTRYLDIANNTVGVNITSFSVFAPMTTGVPALDHINVEPGSALLNIDEPPKSQTFAATGRSKHTDPIPDLMFGWSNTDTSVGGLNNSTGTVVNFTAERVGRAYLTASNGSVTSDQVPVTVDAIADNTTVDDEKIFTATSGDATVTGTFSSNLTGWINITAIGNATNSPEVNSSNPRYGLGSGDRVVSGVIVTVCGNISNELGENGTIHIEICYNTTTLAALGIDASTLAIWKYNSTTEKWVKQSSTISGTCVYIDVDHLCTFGLVGSKATPSGGSSTGGGGGGTYPPGWFGTPTPTVTATKAPAATTTATAAPPGERVTPAPTKKPAMAKGAAPAAEGTTAETAKKSAPGFPAVFAIAGMLAVAYAMVRRRE